MPELFDTLWESGWFRYASATTVGFVIALMAEEAVEFMQRRRVRRAVREALIEEITDNFRVLDSWDEIFDRILEKSKFAWPTSRLNTAMLERCLDASVITSLGMDEQAHATNSYYQCVALNRDIDRVRLLVQIGNFSEVAFLKQGLPVVAQNLLNLLLCVFERQQEFVSNRSTWMVCQLTPLFEKNELDSHRAWRTSNVEFTSDAGQNFIAWTNDARDQIPSHITVIELRPKGGSWGLFVDRRTGVRSRILLNVRRRSAIVRLRNGATRLKRASVMDDLE